ncbi:MAG: GIY-YIG nuclease family protein [Bacteroidales bacterium]|nr:GIY-YIG nuclease family protein [Bacteroidales bacterium]
MESDKHFAIIDIETTGLNAGREKITEIAIILHNGHQVLEEFSTLINPEIKIPYYITQLTGINDQMVAGAPKFYEVARQIVELTEGTTIVGHNVNFDYSFLRAEYKSLGYEFKCKTLDTIKLSRKLIPGQPSYGLGKLCKALNIPNNSRHRAAGDAMATAKLFELLFSIDGEPENISTKGLSSNLSKSMIENLPESHGVYYFFDSSGKMIYVGKSINIKARVIQHLNNSSTKKAIEMKNNIADVDFQPTGSELIALLLESDEIKKHKPVYNRAQRRSIFNYGLYHYTDEQGYLRLKQAKTIDELVPDYAYSSQAEAREHLFFITEKFKLCQRLNGLYPGKGACFHHQIGQCNGACTGAESYEIYNQRVLEALEHYHFDHPNFFVVDCGRHEEEFSVVKVEQGVYQGFGFIPADHVTNDPQCFDSFVKRYPDNREVRQIIRSYLSKNSVLKVWAF